MKIITSVVNNVDFIEMQYHTLKRFFKGDYEFIVFNDAKGYPDFTNWGDYTIRERIEDICKMLNIQCINIPNEHHKGMDMSERHADTFNKHVLKYQIDNPDKYLLLDSDMFLIDDFDINKYTQYECAIVLQSRDSPKINYFWPGLCYLDFTRIQNIDMLDWSLYEGCDSGGKMEGWLNKQMGTSIIPSTDEVQDVNKSVHTDKVYFIKHLSSGTWESSNLPENLKGNIQLIEFLNNDIRNTNDKYFCEIYDNVFLHYRAGGNWLKEGMNVHEYLTGQLKEALLI